MITDNRLNTLSIACRYLCIEKKANINVLKTKYEETKESGHVKKSLQHLIDLPCQCSLFSLFFCYSCLLCEHRQSLLGLVGAGFSRTKCHMH